MSWPNLIPSGKQMDDLLLKKLLLVPFTSDTLATNQEATGSSAVKVTSANVWAQQIPKASPFSWQDLVSGQAVGLQTKSDGSALIPGGGGYTVTKSQLTTGGYKYVNNDPASSFVVYYEKVVLTATSPNVAFYYAGTNTADVVGTNILGSGIPTNYDPANGTYKVQVYNSANNNTEMQPIDKNYPWIYDGTSGYLTFFQSLLNYTPTGTTAIPVISFWRYEGATLEKRLEELTGLQGSTGSTGAAGTAGAQGSTGSTGTAGAAGAQGSTGSTGATGAAGAQGSTGSTGAAGAAGAQGSTGSTGAAGAAGTQGSTGSTGAAGAAGAQGSTGSTGAAGAGGAQGSTGSTGAAGAAGAQGSTGSTGAAGAGGAQGSTGSTGARGAQGSTGSTGAAGAAGAQGSTGSTGAAGAAGAQGSTGSTGAAGAAGAQGSTGSTGAAGAVGAQGSTGSTGAAGAAGAQGSTGSTGAAGAAGAAGAQGSTGSTGPAGKDGAAGVGGGGGGQTNNVLPFWTDLNNTFQSGLSVPMVNAFDLNMSKTTGATAYYGWPILPSAGGMFYNMTGRFQGMVGSPGTTGGQYGSMIPQGTTALKGLIKYASINYTNTGSTSIAQQVYVANYGRTGATGSFSSQILTNNIGATTSLQNGSGNAYWNSNGATGIVINSGDSIGFYAMGVTGTTAGTPAPPLAVYGDIYFLLS